MHPVTRAKVATLAPPPAGFRRSPGAKMAIFALEGVLG
jgi:hypothetical protein